MTLEEYEQSVAQLVRGERPPRDVAESLIRWSVVSWARHGLAQVCPLTMSMLAARGRAESEVAHQLALGGRPIGLHAWGRSLTERLAGDSDPQVALAASLESA